MAKLSIRNLDVKGKRVLVRVDFNVPVKEGKVTDATRIKAAIPTIQFLLEKGARVVLLSHLGRPDGKADPKYSLRPVAAELERLIGRKVTFPEGNGDLVLRENVRFHAEEEANDPKFAKELAALGDIYVNDAFGTAHRAHASTEGVAKHFKQAAAGFLMEKELTYLGETLANPARPFVVILGGAKVSDKILLIDNLLKKVDSIIIGGGMAYTFMAARGEPIGSSKLEKDRIETAKKILADAATKNVKILLPVDHVVAEKFDEKSPSKTVTSIPDGWMALDIGPETVKLFTAELAAAKTVVWNGPLGVFEMAPFAEGTKVVGEFLAKSKATTIVGGGDTAAAVEKFKIAEKMTHVSTGGGASLELLEGKVLPGVAALTDAYIKIAPSLLAADFARLKDEIQKVEAGGADWLHLDVMDGHFVPNLTIGPPIVEAVRKVTKLPLDCHLMIEQPEKYVDIFAKAGADSVTFHAEAVAMDYAKKYKDRGWTMSLVCKQLYDFKRVDECVQKLRDLKCNVGIAINPDTDAECVAELMPRADMILTMTVWPGFGGQKFIPEVMPKVAKLRKLSATIDIEVDGGLNPETVKVAGKAGANIIVAGTATFRSDDIPGRDPRP